MPLKLHECGAYAQESRPQPEMRPRTKRSPHLGRATCRQEAHKAREAHLCGHVGHHQGSAAKNDQKRLYKVAGTLEQIRTAKTRLEKS